MYKMFIFYFLVMLMFNLTGPILPEMLIDKEVISGLNSFIAAIFSLAIFIASPIASKYINTNGLKKAMMFAPLLMAMAQIIMYISPGGVGLLIGRGLTGFFGAFFFMSGSIYVNNFSEPSKKATNFAYLMVASSLGGIVGQVLVGQLSVYFDGYLFAFVIQTTLAIILMFVSTFMIKEIEITKGTSSKKKENFKVTPMLLLVALLGASIFIYSSNIGYYFMDQLNASTSQVALINCLYSIIFLFSNLFIVKIVENYFSLNKLFLLQICGAILGMTLLSINIYYSNPILIFISLVIFIFSLSFFLPIAQKFVVAKKSENSNIELGFINSSYSLGMVIGSIIGGLAYMTEPNLIFIVIIILLIVALAIHLKQINSSKI